MKRWPKLLIPAPSWRRFARTCFRWMFFIGSVIFLIHFAQEIAYTSSFRNLHSARPLLGTALGAVITSLASVTSARGWNLLLTRLGGRATFKQTAAVYCTTQIAKYLPGNVGHYVGRVALAKGRLGVTTPAAVLSLLQETALACLAAIFVGLFCYFFFPEKALYGLPRIYLYSVFALLATGFVSVAAGSDALRKRAGPHTTFLQKFARAIPGLNTGLKALPLYIAGYISIGVAVSLIAATLMSMRGQDVVFITGAYSLAWVFGFLIPGAPGGLGVRESALVLLLAGTYPKSMVLMIALLARLASVGADLITFIVGLLLVRATDRSKKLPIKNHT